MDLNLLDCIVPNYCVLLKMNLMNILIKYDI